MLQQAVYLPIGIVQTSMYDFNVTAGDNFYNTDNATVSANALTISANSIAIIIQEDGNISAEILTLSLIGDFAFSVTISVVLL